MALVRKVKYFKGNCASRTKFHVSIGHTTVMATATFFGAKELLGRLPPVASAGVRVLGWSVCGLRMRLHLCFFFGGSASVALRGDHHLQAIAASLAWSFLGRMALSFSGRRSW